MADLNTWGTAQALMDALAALPERQQYAIMEAQGAFYQGAAVPFPNDLTDEAAELMVELLKLRLATRPRKEGH
jgi:hypothetical protein